MRPKDPDESPATPALELSLQPQNFKRLLDEEALARARTAARMRLKESQKEARNEP